AGRSQSAELRLLEYADPQGRLAAETDGDPRLCWWRPLQPSVLPALLVAAGWTGVAVRDLQPELVLWYRQLCERIAAAREAITREFGREWYEFAASEYAGILMMVRAGVLGGVLVRARAAGA
ncbi:MAG: hypothetical protein IH629_03660, partial [Thermoleophilia bacterium]|nr:hypothetical protein [Thermoleophilia bacterium]